MNWHAVKAIYVFEMSRALRTISVNCAFFRSNCSVASYRSCSSAWFFVSLCAATDSTVFSNVRYSVSRSFSI